MGMCEQSKKSQVDIFPVTKGASVRDETKGSQFCQYQSITKTNFLIIIIIAIIIIVIVIAITINTF